MTSKDSARFRLRAATAADHQRVDELFTPYRLDERADYAAFLAAQASAFLPVEAGLDAAGPEAVLPDWPSRRRAPLLSADLAALGVAPAFGAPPPAFASVEAMLGAIYVLEGSRLGGRLLARSVPEGWPRRFIDADRPELWRDFIEILDTTLATEHQVALAIDAARAVFARFEEGARRHGEDVRLDPIR